MITIQDFEKIDIRVGEIVSAELIPNARYSTHKLRIDFGKEIGIKKSCARIVEYGLQELTGKQILAVVNFPHKQIGQIFSEVLILGVPNENENVILVTPEKKSPLGAKLF
jgi:tRNA-binding protein